MRKLDELHKPIKGVNVIIYKTKKSDLVNYMKAKLTDVNINDVRRRLSKIKGSLAEDVIRHRE